MWFLFTLRANNKLKQIPIQADNYDLAEETLKKIQGLQKYKDEWGLSVWILTCWTTKDEPKEI